MGNYLIKECDEIFDLISRHEPTHSAGSHYGNVTSQTFNLILTRMLVWTPSNLAANPVASITNGTRPKNFCIQDKNVFCIFFKFDSKITMLCTLKTSNVRG